MLHFTMGQLQDKCWLAFISSSLPAKSLIDFCKTPKSFIFEFAGGELALSSN
jgi:hypothetical protein